MDPSNGEVLAEHAIAGPEDVERAIGAAAAAQRQWAALSTADRGSCLVALADLVEAHAEEICMIDALDAGLPVGRMAGDVAGAVRAMRRWPGTADAFRGEVMPSADDLHYTRHAPYGVVGKIVAYNHPFLFAAKGCLAALITGNAVVLKPADQTPLSALRLGELAQEIFPPGVFNVVPGDADTGSALVRDPRVQRIAFTGSARVGRLIQQEAARAKVCSVSLELGGKNPMIVCPDADPVAVANEVVKAMNLRANQGQSCGSTSRLLVHESIRPAFVTELNRILAGLRLGPASDPVNDMGPVITDAHRQRVTGYISAGMDEGARLVSGGLDDPRTPDRGFFVAPTLFDGVEPTMTIAREEIFGPVMTVQAWEDLDDAIAVANDIEYGLTASIWTQSLDTALRLADDIDAGYVWVNDSTTHHWGTSFGGWKNSGVGREESTEELRSYLQTKSVHIRLNR